MSLKDAVKARPRKKKPFLALIPVAVIIIAVSLFVWSQPTYTFNLTPSVWVATLKNGDNFLSVNITSPDSQTGTLTGAVQPSTVQVYTNRVYQVVNVTVIPAMFVLVPGDNNLLLQVRVGPNPFFGTGTFSIIPSWRA